MAHNQGASCSLEQGRRRAPVVVRPPHLVRGPAHGEMNVPVRRVGPPAGRFSPIAPLCTASISHTPARRPCARDQQIRRSRALLNPFTFSSHLLCYVVAATAWIGPNLPRTRFARPLLFNSSTSSLAHASQIPMQEAALDYAQCLFRATASLLRSHSRQSFPGDDAEAAKPANEHHRLPLHLPWDFRSSLRWSCKPFAGRMVASKIGPANA